MPNPRTLDHREILEILPHRYPFLLIDKIIKVDIDGKYVVGQKNVSQNEWFFQGHFPGKPIMPGVLILEALAQTGAVYLHMMGYKKLAALLNINLAKFRSPVFPGDILTLRAEEKFVSSKGGKFYATALVGDKIAAEAEIGCVFIEKENI